MRKRLAGIVFTQMVNPGNPCIYGSFQAVLDLQSGCACVLVPQKASWRFTSVGSWPGCTIYPSGLPGAYASSKIIDAQGGL